MTNLANCIQSVENSASVISCQTPQVTECNSLYWVVGMCCGGVGLVVNPKERAGSSTAAGNDFCGCTDTSSDPNGCPSVSGSDFLRGRMISILPCMKRTYCSSNWGGYGGRCSPTNTHQLSLTFTWWHVYILFNISLFIGWLAIFHASHQIHFFVNVLLLL